MKKRLQHTLFFGIYLLSFSACEAQVQKTKTLGKKEMEVQWYFKHSRIFFTMSAPTNGWVTIGFNTTEKMTNTYLLMGRVIKHKAEVVEYYTIAPGNYKRIWTLDGEIQVQDINGYQKANTSVLQFSLPMEAVGNYQKDLSPGSRYIMTMAYSQEDDFQHHSTMRTSINVEL